MSTPCRECGNPELTNEEVEALYTRVSELSAELVEARGALQHMQDYADATGMCAVCNHGANVCDKRNLCLGADQRLTLRALSAPERTGEGTR